MPAETSDRHGVTNLVDACRIVDRLSAHLEAGVA
jgi:hypothetical protein